MMLNLGSKNPPKSGLVSANDLTLHYLEWESHNKATLVLLHGIGDNAHVWSHFADAFNGAVRIIALDQRGHGRSDWSLHGAYTCEDYVRDIEAFISVLHLDHFVLVGHSMGALHGTCYASLHSNLVAGLVHADIEPCPPEWNKQYLANLYNDLPNCYQSIDEYVVQMEHNSPYAEKELLYYNAQMALNRRNDGTYVCQYDRTVLCSFDRYDIRPYLDRIKCPTLILRGMESRVMRQKIAQEMCRDISDSRFVEIQQAAHPVHIDNPRGFYECVRSFMNEINYIKAA